MSAAQHPDQDQPADAMWRRSDCIYDARRPTIEPDGYGSETPARSSHPEIA
jgi:hypothetical protein